MFDANTIVCRILEDDELDWASDPADPDYAGPKEIEQASDVAAEHLAKLRETEWSIGFTIDTSDEFSIRDSLDHFGIVPTFEFWNQINADCVQIERNLLDILSKDNGVPLSQQGHPWGGSLIGIFHITFECKQALALLKERYDANEPWSTTNGYINTLKGIDRLYRNVSETGAQVLDVTVHLEKDDMERLADDLGW
jgi:hypothetical protein